MFPVIFNFPFMNAVCGFSFPKAISTISASLTVKVVSALLFGGPSKTTPVLRSRAENSMVFINYVI